MADLNEAIINQLEDENAQLRARIAELTALLDGFQTALIEQTQLAINADKRTRRANPCIDCVDGHCNMNCGPRMEPENV